MSEYNNYIQHNRSYENRGAHQFTKLGNFYETSTFNTSFSTSFNSNNFISFSSCNTYMPYTGFDTFCGCHTMAPPPPPMPCHPHGPDMSHSSKKNLLIAGGITIGTMLLDWITGKKAKPDQA